MSTIYILYISKEEPTGSDSGYTLHAWPEDHQSGALQTVPKRYTSIATLREALAHAAIPQGEIDEMARTSWTAYRMTIAMDVGQLSDLGIT